MLKKIIPIENLIYQSTLRSEELSAHLKNVIGVGLKEDNYSTVYIGKVLPKRFEIKRVISYRNSFLPIISGEISDGINGTKVNVNMKLHPFVKTFMIFWLSGTLLASVASTYNFLFSSEPKPDGGKMVFIPLLMLVFGIGLVVIAFKAESQKSIKDLEKLLNARIVEN
ncbi:MAG: hypothetical protein ABIQ27_02340 [Flavobacterium sp.]|uniref:hypothetical protein n=1 Tax=Flavobacterium sp. TaxID=239 RepID=UPI003263BB23